VAALTSRRTLFLAAIALISAAAGLCHFAGVATVPTFAISGVALAGLAWIVALATEAVGTRLGPGATGVLQSTLGNLPEFFVVLFAINAGEILVAQTSLVGSPLANGLLVLGLTIIVGAHAEGDG
jgi:Ca2+:H+ antiporter